MIGQTISQYRILSVIGEGTMGTVYAAEHITLRRPVAIKTLRVLPDKPHYRARFLREALSISALNHPNIATIHDYGETSDGIPFLVMERVDGPALDELIGEGKLTLKRAVEITEGITRALTEAHRHDIIHRDIKPKNVAINERGEVKVLDFGLAKQLRDEVDWSVEHEDPQAILATQTGENVIVGTPMYLSPEQALGGVVDARSDLFSVGSVVYECITGQPAFPGKSAAAVREKVISVNPPAPSSLNPNVPIELDKIVLKALAKKAVDRYQSGEELLADLNQIKPSLEGTRPIPVRPVSQTHGTNNSSLLSVISDTVRKPRVVASVFFATLTLALIAAWAASVWRGNAAKDTVNKEALRWYERGTEVLREGNYLKAVNLFQQALSSDNDFQLARARLAEGLTELELTDRAQTELLRVPVTAPDSSTPQPLEALQLKAIRLSLTGDTKGAIETYHQIVEQSPENAKPAAHVDLGRAYERDGDSKRAIESYQTALTLDPEYIAAVMRLGVLYGRRLGAENTETALGHFKKAEGYYETLKDAEGLAEVFYQQGTMYVTQRKLDLATERLTQSLRRAEAIDSKYYQFKARMQLSSVFCLKGETKDAERQAEDVLNFAKANGLENSMASGLLTVGNAFFVRKELAQARSYFERALDIAQLYKARRSQARALLSLASLATEYHNRPDEVRNYVELALPLYQQEGSRKYLMQGQALLGHAGEQQGDYAAAQQAFTQQLDLALQLGDQEQESLAHEGLGIVFMEQEDYPKALENFDRHYEISKSLNLEPSVGYVQLKRGKVLAALGRYDEAQNALDESEKLTKEHADDELAAEQLLARAQLSLSRRDFPAARMASQNALKLSQDKYSTTATEAKMILGLTAALAGQEREGLPLCIEAHHDATLLKAPRLVSASLLALATAKLAANKPKETLTAALQAREKFARSGQLESEWHALLVGALASKHLGDTTAAQNYASLAVETLNKLRARLNAADNNTYRARPDVVHALTKLGELTAVT